MSTDVYTGLYTTCTKCTCQPGFWIAGCRGSTLRDDKLCYECIQKCPPGYTMHGECDGNQTQDRTCRPNELTESLCDSRSVPDNAYLLQQCRKHSRGENGRCGKCVETCFGPNFVQGKCGDGEQPLCASCRTSDCEVFLNFVVTLPMSRGEIQTMETTYLQAIANMIQVPAENAAMLSVVEEFTALVQRAEEPAIDRGQADSVMMRSEGRETEREPRARECRSGTWIIWIRPPVIWTRTLTIWTRTQRIRTRRPDTWIRPRTIWVCTKSMWVIWIQAPRGRTSG